MDCSPHPEGHGLAMSKATISGDAFDGVTKRMAEVEQRSAAVFEHVFRDNRRLDRRCTRDQLSDDRLIPLFNPSPG